MCGIAGAISLDGTRPISPDALARMLTVLHHRGPEAAGVWEGDGVALGHARLSIIDIEGGLQPLANEDRTVWASVNGEVFNYIELGAELRAAGHRFRTASDSEVLVHLYEDDGPALLERLNGQYAFALWDDVRRQLVLGRDRLGVRPLFYTVVDRCLLFASEIKALLTDPRVARRPDLVALDQVFTYGSALPGRTMFEGIYEVPAGSYLVAGPGREPVVRQYWSPTFEGDRPGTHQDHADHLRELLVDATRLRLRADVPVGAYVSGGLDSSAIAAIAAGQSNHLETFSIAFEDGAYDERPYQELVARELGTEHHVVECRPADIAEVFPDVVWHAETPLLRTGPAPLFILSALVRRHGFKVVLTGEGADEFLAGYDIFKEAMVRRFWARDPSSAIRPQLLRRLYGNVAGLQRSPQAYREAYFKQGLAEADDPHFSHMLRWRSTARLKRLFGADVRQAVAGHDQDQELAGVLGSAYTEWDALSRAQHLEVRTFLTPYLLSSQGDRVAMAHSVEGRFPFLDHRVVELASSIPGTARMVGLHEKAVLKRAVSDLVPPSVRRRVKQPYRAPIGAVFCGDDSPAYVREVLEPRAVRDAGLFDPDAVAQLTAKCRSRAHLGEMDEMALVGVLSAQLWYSTFISSARTTGAATRTDVVRVGELPVAVPA
jgi:asparagine synthase (glutamine-hydrolysing)